MPTTSEIKQMKRGELNELAAEYGLNPDDYSRADDLRSAVFEYLTSQEEAEKSEAEELESSKTTEKTEEDKKPKQTVHPPRLRVERKSKRYRAANDQLDKTKEYALEEAISLVVKTATVNFDPSIEVHFNLNVDPRQADQLVRDTVILPNGSGKTQKVAAIAPDSDSEAIKSAGADLYGYDKIINQLNDNIIDFDILVAHPDAMKDLSKFAKNLGPQGLMPSPKAGTVTSNVAQTVKELKAGRIEYRVDRYGNIHQIIGKASFGVNKLKENFDAMHASVLNQKPSSLKGAYIQKVSLNATMSPAVKLDVSSLSS